MERQYKAAKMLLQDMWFIRDGVGSTFDDQSSTIDWQFIEERAGDFTLSHTEKLRLELAKHLCGRVSKIDLMQLCSRADSSTRVLVMDALSAAFGM